MAYGQSVLRLQTHEGTLELPLQGQASYERAPRDLNLIAFHTAG